ncbi:MAG: Holliday junction branch migration DNA helicase RuvB, partial [Rudaea sp.]
MADRITSPQAKQDELGLDLSLRPKKLEEYIGQDKVKEKLRILLDAAKARGEALDHTL